MAPAIIAAMITGGISLVGIIVTTVMQQRKITDEFRKQSEIADIKLQAKLENFQNVTNEKIDELSRRVAVHNNAIERIYILEQKVGIQDERQKVANHRLDDIERSGH